MMIRVPTFCAIRVWLRISEACFGKELKRLVSISWKSITKANEI